ncbi:XRE family transcriptional regulator [Avibacterium paragallinarum]|uniref:XRE family transcriptional regulator n=1 Tax=Avibacterium paragallinarum TaxID=728 RepID=UPI00397840C4
MNTLGSRLQQVLNDKGITQEKLANMINVSQNTISLIVKGATKKPRNILEIATALDVDPNWLKTGDGQKETMVERLPYLDEQDDEHKFRIDLLDAEAAANPAGIINSEYPDIIQSIWFSAEGLIEVVGRANADGIYLIKVPTDSMLPTIKPKDVVFIDTNINQYIGEGIYAFKLNGETYIKRLQRLPTGVIRALSDNKLYSDFDITDELFDTAEIIGKFIRVLPIEPVDL